MSGPELTRFLITFLSFLIMLTGLAGTVLPALPGPELMWLGALAYGVFAGFGKWGPWLFALITLLTIASEVATFALGQAGAARQGASCLSIIVSAALGLVGMFVIPVLGALLGAMLGVFAVEYYRRRDWKEAWRATTGMLWGYGLSLGAQFVFGLAVMGVWGIWVGAG